MKDPVCGMNVNEGSEFKSNYEGKAYLFCSGSCKERFDKNPKGYVNK